MWGTSDLDAGECRGGVVRIGGALVGLVEFSDQQVLDRQYDGRLLSGVGDTPSKCGQSSRERRLGDVESDAAASGPIGILVQRDNDSLLARLVDPRQRPSG